MGPKDVSEGNEETKHEKETQRERQEIGGIQEQKTTVPFNSSCLAFPLGYCFNGGVVCLFAQRWMRLGETGVKGRKQRQTEGAWGTKQGPRTPTPAPTGPQPRR